MHYAYSGGIITRLGPIGCRSIGTMFSDALYVVRQLDQLKRIMANSPL
jgi:hypothetical protein